MKATTKTCACGRTSEWETLPLVGYQRGWEDLELRNCRCGSTMAMPAPCVLSVRHQGSKVTIPLKYRSLEKALDAFHSFEHQSPASLRLSRNGETIMSIERF